MLVVGVINSHFVYDCTVIAVDATSLRGRINQHWSSRFLVLTQVATGVPRTTFKELELTRPSVSSEGIVGKLHLLSRFKMFRMNILSSTMFVELAISRLVVPLRGKFRSIHSIPVRFSTKLSQ